MSVRPMNAIQRRGCARSILTARLRNYLLFWRIHAVAAISAAQPEGLTAPLRDGCTPQEHMPPCRRQKILRVTPTRPMSATWLQSDRLTES